MRRQCPNCLSYQARPTGHRPVELPLTLVFVQPFLCARCEHRFLRFRPPDRLLGVLQSGRLPAR
jgi:hypothetical protein